jgi:hypothetical protein
MGSEVVKKIIIGLSLLSITFAEATVTTIDTTLISRQLCAVINGIKGIAVVLAVAMFVIGGILYAVGNLLTGAMKQSAHGWAQGLIIGGVVALVLVLIAQPLVGIFAQLGGLSSVNCAT